MLHAKHFTDAKGCLQRETKPRQCPTTACSSVDYMLHVLACSLNARDMPLADRDADGRLNLLTSMVV